jgi:hypothetical protein
LAVTSPLHHNLTKSSRPDRGSSPEIRGDVDGLYDDWFVETCAEWVLPYIGDLLGVQGLRPVPGAPGLRAVTGDGVP